ncbi:GNAT family N-acetyltransferase [Candidatus Woesearchaeota archaeon]|nr:GNAT family N-acetyltransferase [Candidatus Woesearchaeota archaeon]
MAKPVITGNGFILRNILLSDAQGYLECHRDIHAKNAFNSVPETLAEAKKELRETLANMRRKPRLEEMFAIEYQGSFAGFANLKYNDNPKYKHSAVISYGIHEDYRCKGLATKVVKKLTAFAFNKRGLRRLSGNCRSFNRASARVLEKAGYTLEGIQKKQMYKKGKYFDNMLWAKVR